MSIVERCQESRKVHSLAFLLVWDSHVLFMQYQLFKLLISYTGIHAFPHSLNSSTQSSGSVQQQETDSVQGPVVQK